MRAPLQSGPVLYLKLTACALMSTGFAQRTALSALHIPDGSGAGATIMRRGFMAATLESSGAVVMARRQVRWVVLLNSMMRIKRLGSHGPYTSAGRAF